MQVKSIAECSKGSILQYFWPSLSYHLSLWSLLSLFLSGRFTEVLLYLYSCGYMSAGQVDLYALSPLNTLQCVSSVKEKVQALKPNGDRNIEITKWVTFDIKFTRQGFENVCWHRDACRAIQHTFSKPSLVNLISKDTTWYSFYQFTHCFTLQTRDYDVTF